LTAVTLSLRSGNTDVSCRAYAQYAVMLVSMFGDIPNAYRFSEMALRLNETFGKARDRGALLHMHGHLVVLWKHPFAAAGTVQEQAFTASLEVGDLAYAGYGAFMSIWQLIERGDTLDDVMAGSVKYAAFAQQTNNDPVYETIRLEQQFVASLQGKTDDPLGMQDPSFDEASSAAVVTKATFGCGIAFYHIMKEILAFHRGRYTEALAAAVAAEPYLATVMAVSIEATHRFFHALTLVALAPRASAVDKEKHAVILADTTRRFDTWAAECPENFGARSSMLLAEMARMEGRDLDALRLYEAAIQSARANRCIQDEALALELSGQFYEARGLETAARAHFQDARRCYARWGAHGKVEQLEALHRYLREESKPSPSTTIGAPIEHLDLAAVVRVLQALSGEIVLEKWVDRLMTIVLEDAGAQRGVLLVPHGDGERSLAEAVTGPRGVEVRMSTETDGSPDLPRSVLRYVARTQEAVLLDDASDSSPFSTDPYIASRRSRSILCLPLAKQKSVAAMLYLENDLAPSVFTPRRTTVLKLLVSQAALPLENARLHTDLQRENEARKRIEDALRRSEAYLAEAQRLSRTGSFGWDVSTGALVFSDETYRLTGFERSSPVLLDDVLARIHPDDVAFVREDLDRAIRTGGDLDHEHRFLMPDGSVRFLHALGRPVTAPSGAVEYVGALTDVTERHETEAALQNAQVELAHVMRVSALGELAASIAHEVNQPLAAISANANASLNWLAFTPPAMGSAREALTAIVSDSERAGEVLSRIRGLLSRSPLKRAACNVNEIVSGVLPLVRSQFERHKVLLEAALAADLPAVLGDPVQLQQVLLNLLLNAADASKELGPERRRVLVRTAVERRDGGSWAIVAVDDAGKGIDPVAASRMFDAFYTTKPGGLGMGLSISRSIVARHEGELTAAANADHGATLSFRLPGLM
jgi:PAS domain S-box-containing protein